MFLPLQRKNLALFEIPLTAPSAVRPQVESLSVSSHHLALTIHLVSSPSKHLQQSLQQQHVEQNVRVQKPLRHGAIASFSPASAQTQRRAQGPRQVDQGGAWTN